MNMQEPVIEASRLSIGYLLKGGKRKVIHDDLNLRLQPGEVTCLLGLNGAGKSTLLRTLCGFQPPLSGEIRLMGKPLSSYSQSNFSLTVGVVLTEKTNAGGITVYELVSLGRHPYTGFFGQLKKTDREIIEQSLTAAGIAHKAQNYVSELSDGERQKAMIAKALAQQCPIILLDEPTAFLDVTSRIETMVLLHKLAVEQHKAILHPRPRPGDPDGRLPLATGKRPSDGVRYARRPDPERRLRVFLRKRRDCFRSVNRKTEYEGTRRTDRSGGRLLCFLLGRQCYDP